MDIALFATTSLVGRFYLTTTSSKSNNQTKDMTGISWTLLQQQNAATSSALIEQYAANAQFAQLAKAEGDLTLQRDAEDDAKLAVGIEFAKAKGVIDRNFVPAPYVEIDVLGKTPQQVAQIIMDHVHNASHGAASSNVICLVGLSGTGKGTTVSVLRQLLEKEKQVVTWSNGNIFRSVTLLATTWWQQQCKDKTVPFDADKTLTKENLANFMSMLSFGKHPTTGQYDTRIQGLGLDLYVSEVQNTTLKIPAVSKNIPTVAQATQGEVILFAADAVQRMGQDGIFVLLEGRQQTVDYVPTPHRFQLTLSDPSLIGKRRAAQRLMGAALEVLQKNEQTTSPTETQIQQALNQALAKMVKEIH